MYRAFLPLFALTCLAAAPAHAHPIPIHSYDRLVTVHLSSQAITVTYHLVATEETVFWDLRELITAQEIRQITQKKDAFAAFARASQEGIANNLAVMLDGKEVKLTCTSQRFQLPQPERGEEFEHLRCDYVFAVPCTLEPGSKHTFRLREENYRDFKGKIDLRLTSTEGVQMEEQTVPSAELKARAPIDFGPGDENRLRTVSVTFTLATHGPPASAPAESALGADPPHPETPHRVQDLLFQTHLGLAMLMVLAALFGAAHALAPGHGKTLVAAYLVGERGTIGHAFLLGLVTTLTHTGAVLFVAAVAPFLFPAVPPETVQLTLELGGGLLIVVLGGWLLMRRLAGQSDHFHLPGQQHHHHDQAHEHTHLPLPTDGKYRLGQVILLGIGGGIVPCGEAILLFVMTVRWQRLDLAFPLLLAFSAGLATVLVVLGISVVYARRLGDRLFGERPWMKRITRALPILSAFLVTALGIWLCIDSMRALGITRG